MTNEEEALPEETLQALEALGEVLLSIRKRMLSEGFDVVDGKVVPIETKIQKVS